MKSPCPPNCPDRTATCHGECKKFIDYDKERIASYKDYSWKSKLTNAHIKKIYNSRKRRWNG